MNRSIVKTVFTIFSSRVGVQALTVVITPLLVRLLGSDGYGNYSFLLSTLQWLLVLIYAGSFNGIRKHIAEERELDGWADNVFAFYFKIVLSSGILIIVAIILVARSKFVVEFLGEDFTLYFYLVALMIPFRILLRTSRSALMGFGLERYSEPLSVLDRLLFAAIVITLFSVGGDVASIMGGRIIAYGLVSLLALGFVSRQVQLSKVFTRSPTHLPRRQLMTYGLSTMVLGFLTISLYHLDIILLRLFVGSTETGYYRAALVVAEFLWFVPIAIQLALLHSTSKLWAEEQYDRITAISARTVRYTLLFTILLVLGIVGLARPFLSFYFGPEFVTATMPLLLLLPGALGFAAARPIIAISQGQNNLRILILVTAVAAGINVVLNMALIPRFGMNGAAVATSVGYGSMFGLHVWSARQLGFNPLADLRIKQVVITTSLAAIPIIVLPRYIDSNPVELLIVPPIGCIMFVGIALLTGSIELQEIQDLLVNSPFQTILSKLSPEQLSDTIDR